MFGLTKSSPCRIEGVKAYAIDNLSRYIIIDHNIEPSSVFGVFYAVDHDRAGIAAVFARRGDRVEHAAITQGALASKHSVRNFFDDAIWGANRVIAVSIFTLQLKIKTNLMHHFNGWLGQRIYHRHTKVN